MLIIGSVGKIVALFACLGILGLLLKQRLPAEAAPSGAPREDTSGFKRPAVLSAAQRVTNQMPFDFLPFFHLAYPETESPMNAQQRHWANAAIGLLQQQSEAVLPQVLDYARRLKEQYPGFYFGYYAVALVLQRQGDFESACRELEAGILQSQQKYTLYAAMGSLLYDHGDINPALGWWIRSAVSQASTRAPGLSVPFVLLGYVARHCNLTKIADALFMIAQRVDNKPPLLNEQAQEKLYALLRQQGSDTVHQALILLYTEHLSDLLA